MCCLCYDADESWSPNTNSHPLPMEQQQDTFWLHLSFNRIAYERRNTRWCSFMSDANRLCFHISFVRSRWLLRPEQANCRAIRTISLLQSGPVINAIQCQTQSSRASEQTNKRASERDGWATEETGQKKNIYKWRFANERAYGDSGWNVG